jgi:hypothetical protein
MADKLLLGIAGFVLVILVSNAALPSVPEETREQSHFGIFGIITKNDQGDDKFQITDTVPLVEGQAYGWIIKLGPGVEQVNVKEVFELPAKPETWGSGETGVEHEISRDGRISTTEKMMVVEDGFIQNYWSVAAGDPPGDYVIRVYADDRLLETFRFKVVEMR